MSTNIYSLDIYDDFSTEPQWRLDFTTVEKAEAAQHMLETDEGLQGISWTRISMRPLDDKAVDEFYAAMAALNA